MKSWVKTRIPPLVPFIAFCLVGTAALQAQITDLYSFDFTHGASPYFGGLTLSGSTLYGTTYGGGSAGDGVVFSLPVSGGAPTILANFTGANGADPYGGLTLSGGTLYGATTNGGAFGNGVVFSLPVGGGAPTVLAIFNNSSGVNPLGNLTLTGGALYGATGTGGSFGYGTVFSVPVGGGTPTVLANFNDTDGSNPYRSPTLVGSILYGATQTGGANSLGTVYSLPLSGGTPALLTSFSVASGTVPVSNLKLSLDGATLYGTAPSGGAHLHGTVFSVPVGGGSPTVLTSFTGANGSNPYGGLTLSADGRTLYGTTQFGGANGYGEVFSLPAGGGTPTVLASFDNTDGANPIGDLTLSADGGTLYGTTENGGANNAGTVFSVPTPEPGSATLFLTGILVAGARRRRKSARPGVSNS